VIPVDLDRIVREVDGEFHGKKLARPIDRICIDSRGAAPGSLFVALRGQRTDGHRFLRDAFRNGAAAALVGRTEIRSIELDPEWALISVPSPLEGLQSLARWYRRTFIEKVVAITGSNGKTVVKDALAALMADRPVHVSPGSYNSKLGLPLAVLSSERASALAVLEAGVSEPGEMEILESIARPDYGILTNIGMAHLSAFGSREAIAREKMGLFKNISAAGWVLLPPNEPAIAESSASLRCSLCTVGSTEDPLELTPGRFVEGGQILRLSAGSGASFDVRVHTRSRDIIHDLHLAASAALRLGVDLPEIALGLENYTPTQTRMELSSSPDGIRIINDACSSDPISTNAALRAAAMGPPRTGKRIFAFSGMREMGQEADASHFQVGVQAAESDFTDVVLVGDGLLDHTARGYLTARPSGNVLRVSSTDQLPGHLRPLLQPGDTVLFKGPRNGGMAGAARDLAGSISQRSLRLDLAAIGGNIARFQRHCGGRPIIAMLKALAYGTELAQLAFWMPRLGVHHIGVSSTEEGVAVRKTGVDQEIYVFLSAPEDVAALLRYRLTPIVYSADLFEAFAKRLAGSSAVLPVHLKVDTGMHRLGVAPHSALEIARQIRGSGTMQLAGLCTHFAAAEDANADEYTREQIAVFDRVIAQIRADGFTQLRVHAANTAAAMRFPEAHYDMVRVGLGLYGVYPSDEARRMLDLELALAVTSRVAAVQSYPSGARIGYNGTYTASRPLRAGVIPFGYDDGLPWQRSGGSQVLIEGRPAPLVGRVSMDQIQVDLTDLPEVGVGAEALIYGSHGGYTLRPEAVAHQCGTIPHELLTRLGRRVQRIYLEP
jgi:alanine racemase